MTRSRALVFRAATFFLFPAALTAQAGGYGPPPTGMGGARYGVKAPRLPGIELEGPLDSASARVKLTLNEDQARRYAQAYDSFMVATQTQRDSAAVATTKMNARLDAGDPAAATFYVERLQEIGKHLKERQDNFEDNLRKILTSEQVKAYRKWREGRQQAIELKQREDAVRWQQAAFGGIMGAAPELKTPVATAPGVTAPTLGAQAVRVGRALYVSGQIATDSTGSLVGADLRNQAVQAFANLTAVLKAAGSIPRNVVALTIYVVNYHPTDEAAIREAGAAYFGTNAPVATIVGVQSLAREGALISVAATATVSEASFRREP